MKEEVNLLTTTQGKNTKISPFFSISLLILIVTVILVVASLLYVVYLKTTLSALAKSEKTVLSEMSKFDQQRVDLITTRERLLGIKKIISANQGFSQRIGLIIKSIPVKMTVETITIQGSKVSMKISSPSLSSFNTFFNTTLLKLPKQAKSGVKKIDLLGFSIGGNGGYSALVEIGYDTALTE